MRIMGGGLVLALVLACGLAVSPAEGQRGPGFRGPAAGPFAGQSLDVLLEHREELKLEDAQVAQLNELKAVLDNDVKPLAEEMRALRDQIRAGDVDRAEGFRRMEALRGQLITAAAPVRGRVQEILTVEQHRRLQGIVRQDRPGLGRGGPPARGRGDRASQSRRDGWRGGFQGHRRPSPAGPAGFRNLRGRFAPGPGQVPPAGFRRGGGGAPWFQDEKDPMPQGPVGEPGQSGSASR